MVRLITLIDPKTGERVTLPRDVSCAQCGYPFDLAQLLVNEYPLTECPRPRCRLPWMESSPVMDGPTFYGSTFKGVQPNDLLVRVEGPVAAHFEDTRASGARRFVETSGGARVTIKGLHVE